MSSPARIIPHIVEQHAEEAAFLWLLRDKAVDAPHYARRHLARLDERVEAHVDGLRVAGEAGREIAWQQLQQFGEMGELFAAAVTVVETGDRRSALPFVDFAEAHPECLRGLVGALAWADPASLGPLVRPWLDSDRPLERYLGVAACSVHRVDPQTRLARLVEDETPMVRARALRLVGELGRVDLAEQLARALDNEAEAAARFWPAWSLALLTGAPRAITELQRIALGPGAEAGQALDLALRVLPLGDAMAWLKALNGDPAFVRQVVVGLGVVGDPVVVPWLIRRMSEPELARVSGESLSMMTGVDIGYADLDGESPAGCEAGPTEQPADADVKLDLDEHLPWPNPTKVEAWWASQADSFSRGQRYLLGVPIECEACLKAWTEGFQRQRRAAALEIERIRPMDTLMNWRTRTQA